jgi:hypothetical protein
MYIITSIKEIIEIIIIPEPRPKEEETELKEWQVISANG